MAKKKSAEQFTPLELELVQILWQTGPATVQTVHQKVQGVRRLAYNSVQTVLNILHRKGKVERTTENRAYVYRPLVTQEKAAGSAVQNLVDKLFGGKAEDLVMCMIRGRQLSVEQLDELRRMVEPANGEPND